MQDFVHLHVHSQYSLLDGKASVQELVDKAIADGMKGLALTDHGNMFGIKEFYNYVKKKNSGKSDNEKFKPILGCEMYVAREKLTDRKDKSDNGYHLIVLAKNKTGYHNLIKLVSKAWTEGFYYHARTDRDELEKHHEGLIICSACLGGEVPQFILNEDPDSAEERILWYKKVFGDDYYLELQRHQTFKENSNTETFPLQQKVNAFLLEMSKKHGIKVVATNDVHFANEDDAEAHDRLICVSMQKKFNEPRMHYTKQEWLKTPQEMERIFSDLPEALENTTEILDKIEFYSIDHAPVMPEFEIPVEFGTEEEYRKKFSEEDLFKEFTRDEHGNEVLSPEDAKKKIESLGGYERLYRIKLEADYLEKLTWEGAEKRYGTPLDEETRDRIKFELHIMKTMGFPGYFLIVQDFINVAKEKLGVSVGPGRGSAAGSAAAYCLGITQIDPIKYDLLFERFLNPDRISMPDIDVDFDDDGRYEVLKYVTDKYGAEKVAHIITYQTMATKSSIKDVARVMELPLPESNRLAKLIPDRLPDVDGKSTKVNFKNCLKYCKEFAAETNNENPLVREVLKYAGQLEGNVRGTGVHPCGVIIGKDDITDWVPVSMGTDTDGTKVISTQYEGSLIEETGMIKMDFLGLKTLSIIKEALSNIKQSKGIDLDIDSIPLDDPLTYKLYCEGRTTSTFQFESAGMQNSLRELKPSKFEDLIAMNALYRPGPMDYIPSFVRRKHGQEPITYDIPIMEKYLHETYGITVYQEQVMLLSRLLANFTRGESDQLRKAMGKKLKDKMDQLKTKFMEGGQANGHEAHTLEKIWADWEKFASYAFNKSHATCYTWLAYQTAYLKAHYPAEYMAGVLSRNLGNGDKIRKDMDESLRIGISVKGPDVNESHEKFSVNANGEIRFGLGAVKNVGTNTVNAIITERQKNGPFKDIYDFVERVNLTAVNRSAIENLALAGAFDSMGYMREIFFEPFADSTFSDNLVRYGQLVQNDRNSMQASLFDDIEPLTYNRPPIPLAAPWNKLKLLDEEKKLVTVYLSAHPLDTYYMEVTFGANCTCADFEERKLEGGKFKLAGMVMGVEERTDKTERPYGRITLEDFSGKTDLWIFGPDYLSIRNSVYEGAYLFLDLTVTQNKYRADRQDIRINSFHDLEHIKGKIANHVNIYLDFRFNTKDFYRELRKFEGNDRPGRLSIEIIDPESRQKIKVNSRKTFSINKDFVDMLTNWGIRYKIQDS